MTHLLTHTHTLWFVYRFIINYYYPVHTTTTMYNTTPPSQGDFFDEHLSAVLRDIVENDVDFLGEFFEKFRAALPAREPHREFCVCGGHAFDLYLRAAGRRRKSKSPQFAFDSRRVRTNVVFYKSWVLLKNWWFLLDWSTYAQFCNMWKQF